LKNRGVRRALRFIDKHVVAHGFPWKRWTQRRFIYPLREEQSEDSERELEMNERKDPQDELSDLEEDHMKHGPFKGPTDLKNESWQLFTPVSKSKQFDPTHFNPLVPESTKRTDRLLSLDNSMSPVIDVESMDLTGDVDPIVALKRSKLSERTPPETQDASNVFSKETLGRITSIQFNAPGHPSLMEERSISRPARSPRKGPCAAETNPGPNPSHPGKTRRISSREISALSEFFYVADSNNLPSVRRRRPIEAREKSNKSNCKRQRTMSNQSQPSSEKHPSTNSTMDVNEQKNEDDDDDDELSSAPTSPELCPVKLSQMDEDPLGLASHPVSATRPQASEGLINPGTTTRSHSEPLPSDLANTSGANSNLSITGYDSSQEIQLCAKAVETKHDSPMSSLSFETSHGHYLNYLDSERSHNQPFYIECIYHDASLYENSTAGCKFKVYSTWSSFDSAKMLIVFFVNPFMLLDSPESVNPSCKSHGIHRGAPLPRFAMTFSQAFDRSKICASPHGIVTLLDPTIRDRQKRKEANTIILDSLRTCPCMRYQDGDEELNPVKVVDADAWKDKVRQAVLELKCLETEHAKVRAVALAAGAPASSCPPMENIPTTSSSSTSLRDSPVPIPKPSIMVTRARARHQSLSALPTSSSCSSVKDVHRSDGPCTDDTEDEEPLCLSQESASEASRKRDRSGRFLGMPTSLEELRKRPKLTRRDLISHEEFSKSFMKQLNTSNTNLSALS
jgi:hypothetical protein